MTQELFKSVIKQKFKIGMTTISFNIRKLQKFREWVAMVKAERRKCIKQMWKVYLLSMMKINSDHESSSMYYVPKIHMEDLSF